MKALKGLALASVLGASLTAGAANAADELTLQLKWVTQGQFAGYYVAKDKGFYDEEGLDVSGVLPTLAELGHATGSKIMEIPDVKTQGNELLRHLGQLCPDHRWTNGCIHLGLPENHLEEKDATVEDPYCYC